MDPRLIIWGLSAAAAFWQWGPHPTIKQLVCKAHIHCAVPKFKQRKGTVSQPPEYSNHPDSPDGTPDHTERDL